MIMDPPYDRYELMVNGTVVQTPIVLASMAGVVDAEYARARREHAGMVCIGGGYSIDETTLAASRLLVEAGRDEFLTDDPIAEIQAQAEMLSESGLVVAVNMRGGSTPESFAAVARTIGPDIVYEIDAHCRQAPMIAAGCGEALLHDTGRLEETVRASRLSRSPSLSKFAPGWRMMTVFLHADSGRPVPISFTST